MRWHFGIMLVLGALSGIGFGCAAQIDVGSVDLYCSDAGQWKMAGCAHAWESGSKKQEVFVVRDSIAFPLRSDILLIRTPGVVNTANPTPAAVAKALQNRAKKQGVLKQRTYHAVEAGENAASSPYSTFKVYHPLYPTGLEPLGMLTFQQNPGNPSQMRETWYGPKEEWPLGSDSYLDEANDPSGPVGDPVNPTDPPIVGYFTWREMPAWLPGGLPFHGVP